MKQSKLLVVILGIIFLCPFVRASQVMLARKDFFEDIVGLDERYFRKRYDFRQVQNEAYGVLSKFDWNQRAGWAKRKPGRGVGPHRRKAIFEGQFSVPTIAQLKGQPSSIRQGNPGSFRLLLHDPHHPKKTDIRALQANSANNGAAFQIASTFFGPLEGGMYKRKSELTSMVTSPVQGEEASISAAPATIYRKYFMAIDPQHTQFRKDKFYLLYELADRLPMKFKSNGTPYVNAYGYVERTDDSDSDKVAVGIHHDIFVTSGYGGRGKNGQQVRLSTVNNPQRITQIFTSAYDTRFSRGGQGAGYANPLALNVQAAAQMLLKGAYEGTIRAAASKGIKRLYLTLVGGGSFRNSFNWIGKAIWDIRELIKNSGMEVILIYRPDKDRPGDRVKVRTAEDDRYFLDVMAAMVGEISGHKQENKKQLASLINQYVGPFYQGGSPSSEGIQELQTFFDRLARRPIIPAAAQVARQIPLTPPPAPSPPPSPVSPARAQQPPRGMWRPAGRPISRVPSPAGRVGARAPVVATLPPPPPPPPPPQQPPTSTALPASAPQQEGQVAAGPSAPAQQDVGVASRVMQWIQSTRVYQAVSNLMREMYTYVSSWF